MSKRERAAPIIHENGFMINGCVFHVDKKYSPIDAIGQGSYGVVCSVRDTESNEKLAIKKITPMAGDEWDATHTLREIRLMRCLGAHENIISLKDLSMCEEKDELYMMMELADTDLHRLIQSSCPLTEGHIRVIMFQVLSGVKTMHDNGVLHRDLKPGNLLLNKDCELKITDFGLARMMPKENQSSSDQGTSTTVSPMTEYVVTRWYRPPELMLAPNGNYDGAVDMWSVGCILGELITRKPMFPGTDFMDQLTRVFKVIEVPEKDQRGYFIEKDALKFLSSLPAAASNALEKSCKNAGAHALDLMHKLLCFNPKERISADEALAHPFFDGVKEEWGDIADLHLDHSLEFAFEQQSLPLATLRSYICEEVLAFREKATRKSHLQHEEQRTSSVAAADTDCTMNAKQHKEPEPQDDPLAVLKTKSKTSGEAEAATAARVLDSEYDCPVGSGFTIKACEFNVPSSYKPMQVLGEGSYGIVCAAKNVTTNQTVAIKKITPMAGDEWDAKHTLREIRLMRYFGKHPNIASLQNLSTCTDKDELYIMMDMVDTDLHRLIQSKTKLEETHIAAIMYQLLCGARALHENGVLHRDLKPGNILISKKCDVKITDFGLSRYIPHGGGDHEADQVDEAVAADKQSAQLMTEYVVTRWYRPPEIMLAPNGTYNDSVDMWSIGCIFGELLNRRPLFPGTDFIDQLTKVFALLPIPPKGKRGYDIHGDALTFLESLPPCSPSAVTKTFRKASPEAVSLLRRLLCINPQRRINAKQALQHPYFKNIRQQLGEPPEFQVAKEFDFEFDQGEFSLACLRQLIREEVRSFNESHRAVTDKKKEIKDERTATTHATTTTTTTTAGVTAAAPTPGVGTKVSPPLKRRESSPVVARHHEQECDSPASSVDDSLEDLEHLATRLRSDQCDSGGSYLPSESLDSKDGVAVVPAEFCGHDDRVRTTTTSKTAFEDTSESRCSKDDHKDREQKPESDSESVHGSSFEGEDDDHDHDHDHNDDDDSSDYSDESDEHEIQVEQQRRPAGRMERPKSAGPRRSTLIKADSRRDNHPDEDGGALSSDSERWESTNDLMRGAVTTRSNTTSTSGGNISLRRSSMTKTTSYSTHNHTDSHMLRSNQSSAREVDEKLHIQRPPEAVSVVSTSTSNDTDDLPTGWIRKIHSKSGREYFYDTATRTSSWKHPRGDAKANASSNSNSINNSTTLASSRKSSANTSATNNANALPKDWERRSDPKTGRLFYVNLLTKKAFARLPSSVSASILTLGKESLHKKHDPTAKRKVTVPQSPQFSQMSWQKKKSTQPLADD